MNDSIATKQIRLNECSPVYVGDIKAGCNIITGQSWLYSRNRLTDS